MLESWDITHWKGGIHSFFWITKTFLYDIRELRYKQIKMGYQILKCLNIGKSSVLKYDTVVIYALVSLAMNILEGWDISHFKNDIPIRMLKVQTHFCEA